MEECEEWSFLQETVQQRRRKELQEEVVEEQEQERPWTGEIDWYECSLGRLRTKGLQAVLCGPQQQC
jgi:hypothetical protein